MKREFFAVCLWTGLASAVVAQDRASAAPAQAERVRALAPLSVRGVNYYPRETSWGGMWTKTPDPVWRADMALAASLNINSVRTFISLSPALEAAGLLHPDGTPTAAYLARLNVFLSAAWQNGIRAILCFDVDPKTVEGARGLARCLRGVGAVVGTHRDDGRVLMWDLMNEPDDDAKWTEATREYLRASLALVRELDTNHVTTVGLTWRIDRLGQVGLPDVIQYHEYSPKGQLFAQGAARVSQSIANQRRGGGSRPVLIGEFGMSTARDSRHAAARWSAPMGAAPGTEAEQAAVYELVLSAAAKERVEGVAAWCLHDYPIGNPNEACFGLVRADGTLKPAALTLKTWYGKWASPSRAE